MSRRSFHEQQACSSSAFLFPSARQEFCTVRKKNLWEETIFRLIVQLPHCRNRQKQNHFRRVENILPDHGQIVPLLLLLAWEAVLAQQTGMVLAAQEVRQERKLAQIL